MKPKQETPMSKPTRHQLIWRVDGNIYDYKLNDVKLNLPKIINSDIGFQLMFGLPEDYRSERDRVMRNHDKHFARSYSVEDRHKNY